MPEPVTVKGSQPQDIVIDQKHRKFYVADENIGPGGDGSHAAIIVIEYGYGCPPDACWRAIDPLSRKMCRSP